MNIAILAAGYGTRLYPLTQKIAKPLICVNAKPMLNYLIAKIEALKACTAIEEVVVVVNNKFYKDFLSWKKKYAVEAEVINDGSNSPDERRGAVGDMKLAIDGKKCDWLVLGGDNLFEDDLSGFVDYALGNKPYPCVGLYDVKSKREASRFGVATLDAKARIVRLDEKPKSPSSTLAASCIYFFPKDSLGFLTLFLKEHQAIDAAGSYISWLAEKTKVFGYRLEGKWVDIGHFDSLRLAEKEFAH
jgi:glucose-1-phosphate thymidylyltransferase